MATAYGTSAADVGQWPGGINESFAVKQSPLSPASSATNGSLSPSGVPGTPAAVEGGGCYAATEQACQRIMAGSTEGMPMTGELRFVVSLKGMFTVNIAFFFWIFGHVLWICNWAIRISFS